jgi:hypothetical protein
VLEDKGVDCKKHWAALRVIESDIVIHEIGADQHGEDRDTLEAWVLAGDFRQVSFNRKAGESYVVIDDAVTKNNCEFYGENAFREAAQAILDGEFGL